LIPNQNQYFRADISANKSPADSFCAPPFETTLRFVEKEGKNWHYFAIICWCNTW